MKKLLAGLFLLAAATLVTGCLVGVRSQARYDGPIVEYGYEPVLYDGYVVYYADSGMPFIWLNGSQFWIPEARRTYYVSYYSQHRSAYHNWYSHRGEHYRNRRYALRKDEQHSRHKHKSNKKHHKNHER